MKKLFLMLTAVAAAELLAAVEGTVTVQVLNARREPTVKSPVMMRLKEGVKVNVLRRHGENWLEITPPADAPVYVDESLVVGGKAHRAIRMYSGKGRKFPVWGELKKGEAVTLCDDRAFGWVRIVPPERLRLYVVGLYVDGADEVKAEADAPQNAKPEAKPETKPEKKPEAKPGVCGLLPPEKKPEAKPEAKPEKKPEAKPEAKPEKKPEAKPVAKIEAKPEPKLTPAKPDAALGKYGLTAASRGRIVKYAGEVAAMKKASKEMQFCLYKGVGSLDFPYQDFIQGSVILVFRVKVEAGSGVGLRISVNDEDFLLQHSQRSCQVNCGGGFSHAAFLVCYCYNLSHRMQI